MESSTRRMYGEKPCSDSEGATQTKSNVYVSVDYAVLVVSEILLEKGLINQATYNEMEKRLKESEAQISEDKSA